MSYPKNIDIDLFFEKANLGLFVMFCLELPPKKKFHSLFTEIIAPHSCVGLKGLHKTFWSTTKKCENKNVSLFLFQYNILKCTAQEGLTIIGFNSILNAFTFYFIWRVAFILLLLFFFAACDGINALDWEKLLITCNLRISMIVMQYTKVTLLSYHCLIVFSKNSAAGNLKTISGVP